MDVSVLLGQNIDLPRLAQVLDGLGHEGRVHTTQTWSTRDQARLFEAAKENGPLDLSFLVPDAVQPLEGVIHEGKNTLPVFSIFQKRFAKIPNVPELAGYNHQTMSLFTGPGYFVVGAGDGEHQGELAIDYTKLPSAKPDAWPEIVPNGGLIGSLVYGNMIDYLRRLSSHVSIGRAYKHGKPTDNWFALVRRDAT